MVFQHKSRIGFKGYARCAGHEGHRSHEGQESYGDYKQKRSQTIGGSFE